VEDAVTRARAILFVASLALMSAPAVAAVRGKAAGAFTGSDGADGVCACAAVASSSAAATRI
jgi:hypothetical protein